MTPRVSTWLVASVTILAGCETVSAPPAQSAPAARPETAKAEPPAAAPKAPAPAAAKAPPVAAPAPTVAPAPAPAKAPSIAAAQKAPSPAAAKAPPVAAAAPQAAPIDLKSLEQKLKDSSAIGIMTKLSLKNQVDDLVAQFKAFHDGHQPPTLAQLRQPYELLLMKVLSLLQDGDPALAKALHDSREYIWGVLADRNKFLANV